MAWFGIFSCASDGLPYGAVTKPCKEAHADGSPAQLVRVPPRYPSGASGSGYVTMMFSLDPSGTPYDSRVVDSKPPGVFDQAALDALQHWRYCPTKQARHNVQVKLNFAR